MTKKFFSLIYKNAVHTSDERKVIPRDEISTMMTAEEVLQSIQEEAKQYRQQVAEECEELKEVAEQKGFEAGFQSFFEHVAKLEDEIQQSKEEIKAMIVPLAIKAAQKIVGRECELNKDTIVDIVAGHLKKVAQHKKIILFVNKGELEQLESNKEQLSNLFENLESFSIRSREDVEPGGCSIETEVGIINAQLENQWMLIENAFTKMLEEAATR